MKAICISILAAAACMQAQAAPIEFTNQATWAAAAGGVSAITFVGLADGVVVTNQFSGVGVAFTDGNDTVLSSVNFVTDTKGIDAKGSTTLQFGSTQSVIGFDFPGALHLDLFLGAALVYSSSNFAGSGAGFFAGITGAAFDRVVVTDWVDQLAFIDNIYIGRAPIPEPETYALMLGGLGLVGWMARRRRN